MKKILKNMWDIGKIYKWHELIGIIFTILYTAAVFISPIVSKYLVDEVIPCNSIGKLTIGIGIFFVGCMCQPIFGYLKNIVFMKVSQNITLLLREKMFNNVINTTVDFLINVIMVQLYQE